MPQQPSIEHGSTLVLGAIAFFLGLYFVIVLLLYFIWIVHFLNNFLSLTYPLLSSQLRSINTCILQGKNEKLSLPFKLNGR